MAATRDDNSTLDTIIGQLTERMIADGTWSISTDQLEETIDPVTLYRAVFELKLIGRDVFTPECAGELIHLLERVAFPDAEPRMRAAGLFLSHEDRIGLTELFVRSVKHALVVHVPEPEIFRNMVTHFKRYDIAIRTYCDSYLNLEPVIASCAEHHAEGRPNAAVHRGTASWYLHTLVVRRIVMLQDLGPALFELLRTVARREGALPPLGRGDADHGTARRRTERRDASAAGRPVTDRGSALAVLRLEGARPSAAEIRASYRVLMRRYHPDVNPEGLEMAKRINAAYALLIDGRSA